LTGTVSYGCSQAVVGSRTGKRRLQWAICFALSGVTFRLLPGIPPPLFAFAMSVGVSWRACRAPQYGRMAGDGYYRAAVPAVAIFARMTAGNRILPGRLCL